MARIETVAPGAARGLRKLVLRLSTRDYGYVPGIAQVLLPDLRVALATTTLYNRLHLRRSSPLTRLQREMLATVVNGKIGGAPWLGLHTSAVRRLTGNEHLTSDFATEWPTYDLDERTRALLAYVTKLTEAPSQLEDTDVEALRAAGWGERAIWEATALTAFFNFSGRIEAASGLPPDKVPSDARPKEGKPDAQGVVELAKGSP
jgi:uncharacterized peroxidase-related enzyme